MRASPLLTVPVTLLLAVQAIADGGRTAAEAASDGNKLLAQGAYADAARAYGEAIDADPTSYLNHYKRATAYLSLGRHSAALDDFDAILRLNPSFAQAHYQKAKVLAKEGDFDQASSELKAFAKSKADPEAEELARHVATAAIEASAAHKAAKKHKWTECVEHATRAIETGPNSADLRGLRASCNTELGDYESTYADLSRLAMLQPANQELRLRLANLAYFMLDTTIALNEVKKCLHYDPENRACKKMHKLVRGIERDVVKARNFIEGGNPRKGLTLLGGDDGVLAKFDAAMAEAESEGLLAPQFHPKQRSQTRLDLYSLACRGAVDANNFSPKSAAYCTTVLELDAENEHALVFHGERLLKEEKWDEAVNAFQRAFEQSGRQSQDIMNRMQKAQRLLKQSKQKDYYKVLGIPRDADDRTIKKAFRKAAKTNHPDVGGSEEKMAQINEAYEVLSDPELRARFDNGDDPNDPASNSGAYSHHGGGFPGQGMPHFFQQAFQGGQFGGGQFGGQGFGGGGHKFHFQQG